MKDAELQVGGASLRSSGEAQQIRHVALPLSKIPNELIVPGAGLPARSRRILAVAYTAPVVFILAARLFAGGGKLSSGLQLLAGAAIAVEAALLLFKARLQRRLERAVVRWTVRAGRHDGSVFIVGTVAAGATLTSELSDRSAVLMRTRCHDKGHGVASDTLWGVAFAIAADDGVRYAVAPSEHLYFDEPPPAPRDDVPVTESLLCPGDRVQVWGTAAAEPSPTGERTDPRSPPLRWTLVGSERSPLVLRMIKLPMLTPPVAGPPASAGERADQRADQIER